MKKQVSGSMQELPQPDELELKINNSQEPIAEYINFLRNQIKYLGNTIDSEFETASELIFRYLLYNSVYTNTTIRPSSVLDKKPRFSTVKSFLFRA